MDSQIMYTSNQVDECSLHAYIHQSRTNKIQKKGQTLVVGDFLCRDSFPHRRRSDSIR
jgi:hypothetical protein